jgi:hypothetical protein
MTKSSRTTRRQFLKASGAVSLGALAAPYFVPSSALGLAGAVAPSERIVLGAIGTGGQGRGDLGALMGFPEIQAIAVCDVDENHKK